MAAHDTVAHAWAHQTGKARKGYNMFYDGPSLFSHGRHWELARLVTLPDGDTAAMLYEPSRTRSVSTHTHFRTAQAATSHMPQFCVQSFTDHAQNYAWFLTEATDAVAKAKRARKYGASYLNTAERNLTRANEYNAAWCLDHDPVTLESLPGFTAQLRADAQARAERDRADREARERIAHREYHIRTRAELRAWLKGNTARAPHTSRPFCRVKGDTVETSHGASVPLTDALRLFRVAKACRAKGEGWQPCGLWAHKAGDFAVTRIGPTGNIVAGCHDIPYRFAKIAADLAGITI